MPRLLQRTAVAFSFAAAIGGCSSFLDAENATKNPNLPSAATRDQLFVGAQANIFSQQEGPLAMVVCQWMQQCAGIGGRFVQVQDSYNIDAADTRIDLPFQEVYSAGGLLSLRAVQASAEAEGDQVYRGIAQVLEALLIGTTADIWGDVPYSDAVAENPTPAFDDQMDVYTAVQTLLDDAISNIGGSGEGPGVIDLFFGDESLADQKTKWIQVARTLKARYHLHTAERLGTAAYTAARAAAQQGIATAGNDLRTRHSGVTSERNMWVQFQKTSGFGQDLVAGKRLVDLMIADSDNRLPDYFGRNLNGDFGGQDVTSEAGSPARTISPLSFSEVRYADDFRQPIATWEENQLILAETNFVLAGAAAAQPFLDAVRAANGKPSKPATLQAIMEEKYISLFQNLEVWNDWKRTCIPQLTPAFSQPAIPGRIYYGATEEQTNPNTPASSEQNLFTVRNPNDTNGC